MARRHLLLALLLPGLALPLAAENVRWTRSIEVDTVGKVMVALEGHAAERARLDLELRSPDGSSVAATLHRALEEARPVSVVRVVPQSQGWLVEFDAGALPAPHQGLRFELAQETAADGVLLEGSSDGKTWQELSRDNLFRLGADQNLQSFELHYPASGHRYLRLFWPIAAGLPELHGSELLPAAITPETRPVVTECAAGTDKTHDCFLDASEFCRTLEIPLAQQEAPIAYELWRAEKGAWQKLRGGERSAHGPIRLHLPSGGVHRLRLESPVPPRVGAVSCEVEVPFLVFEAAQKGSYQLRYGGFDTPELPLAVGRSPAQGARQHLGPETQKGAVPWPRAVLPGAVTSGEADRSWPITTEARENALVVLPLPAALSHGSSLRIDSGGRQLPFLSEIAEKPELIWRQTARPVVVAEEKKSVIELRLEKSQVEEFGDAGGELLLFAHGPFERTLRFVRTEKGAPGQPETRATAAGPTRWRCGSSQVRSCGLRVSFRGKVDGLRIEIDDGDNAPLPAIEIEHWVPRRVLYFVFPGNALHLRELSGEGAPTYDMASLAPLLDRKTAVRAKLGSVESVSPPAEAPRYLLLTVIALAALALLAVLARILKS